ncbi:unnamed protein product [Alopecurus aequalis]
MACSDKVVIPEEVPRKEQRVKGKEFAREIQSEKMRKALVVVVEALEPKIKGEALVETGKGAMAVDKIQSVEALLEALVALVETGKDAVSVDKKQTERSVVEAVVEETGKDSAIVDETFSVEKLLEGAEWRDDEVFEGEVDEEKLKLVAQMQEDITRMWDDCVKRLIEGGVEFGDPSVQQCLVAC